MDGWMDARKPILQLDTGCWLDVTFGLLLVFWVQSFGGNEISDLVQERPAPFPVK